MAAMTEPPTEPPTEPSAGPTADEPASDAPAAEPTADVPAEPTADEPASAPPPGDRRPATGTRLPAPPSQRYVAAARAEPAEATVADTPSAARGLAIGGGVAAFCAAIIAVLGGAFTFTAGLIVVAFFLGRLTAIGVDAGAGDSLGRSGRLTMAVTVSLAAVAAAQVALWIWAYLEGGRLGLIDFLDQTYGPLVPLQFLLAGGAAWLKVR